MVIPREDNMVRLYIQVASSTDKDWNPRKFASEEEVQQTAKKILAPYHISWDRIEWYSCYPIGQGIAEKYTLDERVLLGGDACHTHSVSPAKSILLLWLTFATAQSRTRHEYRFPRRPKSVMEDSPR